MSNLKLLFLSLKPFFPVLSLQCLMESLPGFPVAPFQILEGCYEVSMQAALLQAEQPQHCQPGVFILSTFEILAYFSEI